MRNWIAGAACAAGMVLAATASAAHGKTPGPRLRAEWRKTRPISAAAAPPFQLKSRRQPATKFGCRAMLTAYPGRMKFAAVTTTPETIPAY